MTALIVTITIAGMDRCTAAQGAEDIDLTIAQVGVTAAAFEALPALTALPGEFKRLGTVSGEALPGGIAHLTIRDQSADTYTVRGIGLYLADSPLFAFCGQADAIAEKSPVSTILIAFDMKFPTDDVGDIRFGDANFDYPPATETSLGVAELATQGEVDAGTDAARIVTPRTLGERLKSTFTRQILTSDLATGGGSLGADLTIDVPIATGPEILAGASNSKALTPISLAHWLLNRQILTSGPATGGAFLGADRTINVAKASVQDLIAAVADDRAVTPASLSGLPRNDGLNGVHMLPGGLILQWGSATHDAAGTANVTCPIAFPNVGLGATASNGGNGTPAAWAGVGNITQTGMTVFAASATGKGLTSAGVLSFWFAWGY